MSACEAVRVYVKTILLWSFFISLFWNQDILQKCVQLRSLKELQHVTLIEIWLLCKINSSIYVYFLPLLPSPFDFHVYIFILQTELLSGIAFKLEVFIFPRMVGELGIPMEYWYFPGNIGKYKSFFINNQTLVQFLWLLARDKGIPVRPCVAD